MTIKKFEGKTEEEAIAKAKEEFGQNAVIMNVKTIKSKGVLRAFKGVTYEVTAAMEEEEPAVNPAKAMMSPLHRNSNINMLADEQINIPPLQAKQQMPVMEPSSIAKVQETVPLQRTGTNGLEEKLENLQSLLEKKFVPEENMNFKTAEGLAKGTNEKDSAPEGSFVFLKMIYGIMLENEINEKYVNQILDEVEKVMRNGANVDFILSNIYQKMILKFGQPQPIELPEKKPKVIFFIGPTGVGKTTTIAKIASKYKVENGRKIAMLTADTYRIAAAEQLRTYANILDTPLSIVYSAEELNEAVSRVSDYDFVLVDTAGFSHKNDVQRDDIKQLIENVDKRYEKEIFLVLSSTTKYTDLVEIADTYKEICNFKMIFTKLDETTSYGNIFNMKMYTGAELSYATYGQNVPDDIEVFNTQKIVKLLLGGK